jgi:hypothetical protein
MYIVISTLILIFLIDTFLVGVTFFALKDRFQWAMSRHMSFLILFIAFGFLEYYLLPFAVVLDVTFTVHNSEIASLLDLKANEPFAGLFNFGLFEILLIVVQSLVASLFGEKVFTRKPSTTV